jgi:exopolyphosphatase/guanosine-5'-triphosphate,3'-diphosphate pyrophosphatase
MPEQPIGIIDIGSNSVRLVVYAGATRIPFIIFNEKVMAGLGKAVSSTGELSDQAQERALAALRRFAILVRQMGVSRTRVVATAAVRDAPNGGEFLDKVRALGFEPEMLSGEYEGIMAGQGVLSAIPEADGIVGDLGGGSLELVDIAGGKILRSVSLPLGVLRLCALAEKGEGVFRKKVVKALDSSELRERGEGRPFYMVGGSWRALARLDMQLTRHPLPITHHYTMAAKRPVELQKALKTLDKINARGFPPLPISRLPTLPGANLLLRILVEELCPSELVTSAFGLREGLLYDKLSARTKALDPLLEAARKAGEGVGRFPDHGDLLDAWIAPVFDDEPRYARIRRAACLLSDVAWQAHPDFRAERGLDMALHGNWVGIDAPGRVMLGQALFYSFGGGRRFGDSDIGRLCSEKDLHRASLWGLAMRLGHRFSGGVMASLSRSRLRINGDILRLEMHKADGALYGEIVERRLCALADALGLKAEAVTR